MKRREFLKAGVIGTGIGMSPLVTTGCTSTGRNGDERRPAATGAGGGFVRYEVRDPNAAADLRTYTQAVEWMRQYPTNKAGTSSPNGWSWQRQAEIHVNSCPHGSWNFFPWHREYLYRFEEIIRAMTGTATFSLPYWDWSNNASLPDAFMSGALATANDPRVAEPSRRRRDELAAAILRQTSPTIMRRLMSTSDFEAFMGSVNSSGQIESGPHNGVHSILGGTMGEFTSPLDPIFWLHHCNVDRLWAEWQIDHPEYNADSLALNYGGWLRLSLAGFYDVRGDRMNIFRSARDVLSTNSGALRYAYDSTLRRASAPVAAAAPPPPPAAASRRSLDKLANTSDKFTARVERIGDQASYAIVEFPEFAKKDVARYLNLYIREHQNTQNLARVPSDDLVYRLRVYNFPQVQNGVSMHVAFLNGDEPHEVLIHNFFNRTTNDDKFASELPASSAPATPAQHDHAAPSFNFDYKLLLDVMSKVVGLTSYPARTRFEVRFLDSVTLQPVTVSGDFSKLIFNLVIQG